MVQSHLCTLMRHNCKESLRWSTSAPRVSSVFGFTVYLKSQILCKKCMLSSRYCYQIPKLFHLSIKVPIAPLPSASSSKPELQYTIHLQPVCSPSMWSSPLNLSTWQLCPFKSLLSVSQAAPVVVGNKMSKG